MLNAEFCTFSGAVNHNSESTKLTYLAAKTVQKHDVIAILQGMFTFLTQEACTKLRNRFDATQTAERLSFCFLGFDAVKNFNDRIPNATFNKSKTDR